MDAFTISKPIWVKNLNTEKNITLGFKSELIIDQLPTSAFLKITASSFYRCLLNGSFIGCGPARGPHNYYRIDILILEGKLLEGLNILTIEVASYNVNSYYLLDQPPFLQAELVVDDVVRLSTDALGSDFKAALLPWRVKKVQRYSFQRPFSEVYKLDTSYINWWNNESLSFDEELYIPDYKMHYLPRGVSYPAYNNISPCLIISSGYVKEKEHTGELWKDRSLTAIREELKGYKESELETIHSIDLQKYESVFDSIASQVYYPDSPLNLGNKHFNILDFKTNLTGFIGAKITCRSKCKLFLVFDEILTNNDVDFKRMDCVNIVSLEFEAGSYNFCSFEPYTFRYLKVLSLEGHCDVTDIILKEYANPDTGIASFKCDNDILNGIFSAGKETFKQNAVDLLTDCPSRERAGWLCDSFFTARVEKLLTGKTIVEKNFIENYLLPESFEFLPQGMIPMCYPADHNDRLFIPNFALWFIIQLDEYVSRTGDWETIQRLKGRVDEILNYLQAFENEYGLLEKLQGGVFIEWSKANDFVQDVNYPANMLYCQALRVAARLYGNTLLAQKADSLKSIILSQSYNGEFFVDNSVRIDGKLVPTNNRTEICQYYAFYFDIADFGGYKDLWIKLRDHFGPSKGVMGNSFGIHPANALNGYYLRLELLSRFGEKDKVLKEIAGFFGYMAETTGTLWENNGSYASCNHGFASHVTNCLFRDALGIQLIDANNRKVVISFHDTSLTRCGGYFTSGFQGTITSTLA